MLVGAGTAWRFLSPFLSPPTHVVMKTIPPARGRDPPTARNTPAAEGALSPDVPRGTLYRSGRAIRPAPAKATQSKGERGHFSFVGSYFPLKSAANALAFS